MTVPSVLEITSILTALTALIAGMFAIPRMLAEGRKVQAEASNTREETLRIEAEREARMMERLENINQRAMDRLEADIKRLEAREENGRKRIESLEESYDELLAEQKRDRELLGTAVGIIEGPVIIVLDWAQKGAEPPVPEKAVDDFYKHYEYLKGKISKSV